jgi:hypothetical protein
MESKIDVSRYKLLLLEKQVLNQQGTSLVLVNKAKFLELLAYGVDIESHIFYRRRESYFIVMSQYLDNSSNFRI